MDVSRRPPAGRLLQRHAGGAVAAHRHDGGGDRAEYTRQHNARGAAPPHGRAAVRPPGAGRRRSRLDGARHLLGVLRADERVRAARLGGGEGGRHRRMAHPRGARRRTRGRLRPARRVGAEQQRRRPQFGRRATLEDQVIVSKYRLSHASGVDLQHQV